MAADEDTLAIKYPPVRSYYIKRFYCLLAALILYQLPRLPMYVLTLWRKKSYIRLKRYFRTRIGTFIILFLTQAIFFFTIIGDANELASIYEVEKAWVIVATIGFMFFWLAVDFYWSA